MPKTAKQTGSGVEPTPIDAGVRHFYKRDGSISIARVTSRLGLSKRQLAETLGVEVSGFSQQTRALVRVTEMLEIVQRIRSWAGGEAQALAWYRSEPLPAFGDRTAEALVKEGKAAAVRDYLDLVATGGFA